VAPYYILKKLEKNDSHKWLLDEEF